MYTIPYKNVFLALAIWPTEKVIVFGVTLVIGLTKGTRAVFQSVILPKYVGLDKIAAANGINMLFTGFVSLIVGPLIGKVKIYLLNASLMSIIFI